METARAAKKMSSVSQNLGQNLAGFLIPPQQTNSMIAALWQSLELSAISVTSLSAAEA